MEFFRRAEVEPRTLGVFSGTFNPPTRAHLALARAALSRVDEVLFVLPRAFPHKRYEGATFADRLAMIEAALAGETRYSIAATEGGLFVAIARECRAAYAPQPEIFFLCGRDAAERIVNWDYGTPGAIAEQLREYQLLVAARQGGYSAPPEYARRIHMLALDEAYDSVSATDVRERIARGEAWEHLVPEPVVEMARRIYRREP
jgi:nicotinate-nucleotide adenylyltransferase